MNVDYDRQQLDEDGIREAEARKRKSSAERMKDTEEKYNQHRRERKANQTL